jgi:hypothetical protein
MRSFRCEKSTYIIQNKERRILNWSPRKEAGHKMDINNKKKTGAFFGSIGFTV